MTDFHEDDEPVEKVRAAYAAGQRDLTRPPAGYNDTLTLPAAASVLDFTWRGTITGLHDGDTVWIDYADMGAGHRWHPLSGTHWLIRLAGIAARELHYPDANGVPQVDEGGNAAAANLAALLPPGTHVWLRRPQPDHYGNRLDAWLYTDDGASINDRLVADGWALPWNGQGSQPKPVWPRVPEHGVGYVRAATEWKVGA